jgi:hypothetical protein
MLSDIRRRLKLLADLLADEAERNPEFASALVEILGGTLPPKKSIRAEKIQAPDPFEALRLKGNEEFQKWLNDLSIKELKAIVRQQRFDPSRLSDKWKTKDRFVQLILDRVESRSKQGEAFRFYGKDSAEGEGLSSGSPTGS